MNLLLFDTVSGSTIWNWMTNFPIFSLNNIIGSFNPSEDNQNFPQIYSIKKLICVIYFYPFEKKMQISQACRYRLCVLID